MIDIKLLELDNVVYVDDVIVTETPHDVLRGTVISIKKDEVGIRLINGLELVCSPNKIYEIPLFTEELVNNLGFTPRFLSTSKESKNDFVKSVEVDNTDWYLLEITTEDSMLTIRHNGNEVVGMGKATSVHHLQNLVNQITNKKIKIEGL